jgi:hypothetical protein
MDSPINDRESVGSSVSSERECLVDGSAFHPAAKPDDWAAYFPFPTFSRRKRHDDHEEQLLMRHRALEDDFSSGDENCAPPVVVSAHPMSSDWNLRDEPFAVDRHEASCCSTVMSARRNEQSPVLSIEELTGLTSMTDLRHPSNGMLKMQHVDLSWMARRHNGRISPPSVHLCLANLHAAVDAGNVTVDQVLINSPRSAVLIIRKGIELEELLRRPWAEKRHKHQASFGSVTTMSAADQRELAAEKGRQRLLRTLENEYEAMCRAVELEDILQFFKGYRFDRPSSALRSDGHAPTPTLLRPSSSAMMRSQSMIMRDRLASQREHVSSVIANKTYMDDQRRRQLVEKIHARDEMVAQRLAAIEEEHRTSLIYSKAREEKWFAKHNHSTKVATFRQIVSRERSRFRFDEAVRRQAEEQAQKQRFAEHARRSAAPVRASSAMSRK